MSIKVLTPQDEESKRLVDWIEVGQYPRLQLIRHCRYMIDSHV